MAYVIESVPVPMIPEDSEFYKSEPHWVILALLPSCERDAMTLGELRSSMGGMSARKIKEIISELRTCIPVVSKETDGGGYWIADNPEDVRRFMIMISNRRDGYNRTLEKMQKYL